MRIGTGISPARSRLQERSGGEGWAADGPRLQSLQGLQRALQKTTELLASELGRPTAVAPD
jgi:hypothetical protein